MGIQSGRMEASAMMNCFRGRCNRSVGGVEGRREHLARHDSLRPKKSLLVGMLSRRTAGLVAVRGAMWSTPALSALEAALALEVWGVEVGVGVDVRAGCMILISPVATFSAVQATMPTGEERAFGYLTEHFEITLSFYRSGSDPCVWLGSVRLASSPGRRHFHALVSNRPTDHDRSTR